MEFSSFLYQTFVCHVSSKEIIIFISFHNKIWRYHDVTTVIWQNHIIIIVYFIFLKCLNKMLCLVNGGFYPQQRLTSFEKKKHKKQILLTSCITIVVVEQHYRICPKNDFSQKSLFGFLNHLWCKPKTIKSFFFHEFFGLGEGKG